MMSILEKYCRKYNLDCWIDGDKDVYVDITSKGRTYELNFFLFEDEQHLNLVYDFEITIPENKLGILAEFIARINRPIINPVGYFELDMDSGYMRFIITNILANVTLNFEIIDDMLEAAVIALDIAYPGLMAILQDGATAKEAYKIVENNLEEYE